MNWFSIQIGKPDIKAAVAKVFGGLRAKADQRDGFREFYLDVLRHPMGPPRYFQEMFSVRASGGPFNGRVWQEISPSWRDEKIASGYPGVIGQWKGKLMESLTEAGSSDNLLDADEVSGYFGSSVRDTSTGKAYSGKFNRTRPVIDERSIAELRLWFRNEGHEALSFASERLKARWLEALKSV